MKAFRLLWVLAISVFFSGCSTPSNLPRFTPVTSVPPDKALVYIYRKANLSGSIGHHQIMVNGKPVTVLYNGSYHPYLATPGTAKFGSALINRSSIMNAVIKDDDLFTLNAEAGKTYYVQFKIATTWGPKIVPMDEQTGAIEISQCRLAGTWMSAD